MGSSTALLAAPRAVMCLCSLLLDVALYRVSRQLGLESRLRWLLLLTSHVMLVFQLRTFGNSVAAVLLAASLLLTGPGAARRLASFAGLGALTALGLFIHITTPVFVAPLWLALVAELWLARRPWRHVLLAGAVACAAALATALACAAADTWFYFGTLRRPLELTPLNNLRYNWQRSNLALHGLHPPITHLFINGFILLVGTRMTE